MPFFKLNDIFAGRYELTELLGEGDSSEVWKAKDQMADDAEVVLKIYAPEKGLDEDGIRRFRKEYARFQQFSHPHLLKPSHFDVSEGVAYMIMPFCSRGSLSSIQSAQGSLSEKQVALVLSQIGSALEALHRQNPPVLHQHVRPDNIVLSQPNYFMLADYSIGSQKGPKPPESAMESKLPTEAYAPPESFDRYQKSDPSGDIFSLGATLYEMCGKNLPWGASGSQMLLKKEFVPQLPDHYPAELNELLQACMAVDSAKRPGAGELHLIGKHFLETGHWNLSVKENGEGKPSKRLMPYLLAGAVFALLLLVGAFWASQNKHLGNPIEGLQKMATSVNQDQDQDVNEMLIAALEEELEYMTRRNDSLNTILNGNQDLSIEKNQEQLTSNEQIAVFDTTTPKRDAPESNAPEKAAPATKKAPRKDERPNLEKQIEQQLNKVSDPEISGKARQAWKEETMAQFSADAIRIIEETEGTPKQYSPGIFLNLLMNVPHTIVVKEVKRDENQKVTELRLMMQPKT